MRGRAAIAACGHGALALPRIRGYFDGLAARSLRLAV